MSDRLDRIEKIVESNSRAIESWANESVEFRNRMEIVTEELKAANQRLETTTTRIVDSIELLTQVVVRLDARQQDQENRISRLEQD
jgi:peptidoglycan hydrolase CwlO-like protein